MVCAVQYLCSNAIVVQQPASNGMTYSVLVTRANHFGPVAVWYVRYSMWMPSLLLLYFNMPSLLLLYFDMLTLIEDPLPAF